MDISHVNHPNGGAKHLWTNMDMVWSNNLVTILYRCIFAKPSTTHMENDENENVTPTQELHLKPKMHVFFLVFLLRGFKNDP